MILIVHKFTSSILSALAVLLLTSHAGSALAGVKGADRVAMKFGQSALPPKAYLEFCRREPADCGPDAAQVLREVAKAEAERSALLAMMTPSETPASVRLQGPSPDPPIELTGSDVGRAPATTPISWALMNKINGAVNRAVTSQADLTTYGLTDYWATPLEDGRTTGDCEDYVLEKQRALIASGAPRESLSIAVVTTGWGEAHAVLLVATSQGEFVLDNLTSKIAPWSQAPYHWNMRQLPGQSFQWIMVDNRP
ncbi:MAG: hypothetical protein JWP49_1865 [Phenylobacterium sp.]|nr:hypothetical protein [Phenylobacterium sp.]